MGARRRRRGDAGPYPDGSLNRLLVALAIRTGIPPSVWADEGEAVIITALHLLDEAADDTAERGQRSKVWAEG